MALSYDFLGNNFTTYTPIEIENPEVSKVNFLELFGDLGEIPGIMGQLPNGILMAEDNSSKIFSDNPVEEKENTVKPSIEEKKKEDSVLYDVPVQEYSKAPKDVMDRAVKAAKYLVNNGNFTKEQASAIVGVMIDENKVDPASYMKAEKAGKGVKGTGGFGYGAGIGSWTFKNTKNKLLE
jgi:hypothetical protein